MEDILPDLTRARVFSVDDVRNSFWHVGIDEQSSLLTTFNTQYGRYRWLRMPFRIAPAPEVFLQKLHQTIEGLPGIFPIADDVLIVGEGANDEEANKSHDRRMEKFLKRCRERNIRLNKEKFKYRLKEVQYMGHILTQEGLKPDPRKVSAVADMPPPTDVSGVRRFLGMVTYLSQFLSQISDICEPLRQLTHKDAE